MAKITAKVGVNFEILLTLNETELSALDALVGYGVDPFLKVFYEKLGKAYMEPHEKGLRSLFDKIDELRPNINAMDAVLMAAKEAVKKYSL